MKIARMIVISALVSLAAGCFSIEAEDVADHVMTELSETKASMASATPTPTVAPANTSTLLGTEMPSGTSLVQSSYSSTSSREAWGYPGDRLDWRKDIPIRTAIFAAADTGLLGQGWQQCTIFGAEGSNTWIKPGTDEVLTMEFMSGPPKIANVYWKNWGGSQSGCKGRM